MELARGIEPPTCGLQNRCSAIELRQPDALVGTSIPTFPRENLTTAYEAVKGTYFATGLPHCGYFKISEYAMLSSCERRVAEA
jgi:hypothetical protein